MTRDNPSSGVPGDHHPDMPRGLIARFRNYFLTGLIVAGPVAITLYLTWWFVNWVDNLVRPFVPIAYRPETYLPFVLPGSGLIVAVFALTMLGFLTANLIGRTLVDLGEKVLGRMPVVRAIYREFKQVFETLFSGSGSSLRRVGLVEFPSPGMWSIVLISQVPSTNVAARTPRSGGTYFRVPALRPQSDDRFLFLRAQEQGRRDRHDHGGGGNTDHVCRRRSAKFRLAEEARSSRRNGRSGARCKCVGPCAHNGCKG